MCSPKAFINENQPENCTREHSNISILYCTYREKTVIRANRVSYKKEMFLFTDPLFGWNFLPPTAVGGRKPLQETLKREDFQQSTANISTREFNKIPAGSVDCDKTQDRTDSLRGIYSPVGHLNKRATILNRRGSKNTSRKPCFAVQTSPVPRRKGRFLPVPLTDDS